MMARLLWLALLLHGCLASQNAARQGRKLFGGYRIVPKACHSPELEAGERGVCMFHLECARRAGAVVGSCVDGFLFGTCCRLPAAADDELALPEAEMVLDAAAAPPPPPRPRPRPPPAMFDGLLLTPAHLPRPQSPPDTVLVHHNGSHVTDSGDLQDLFEPATHYNVSGSHEPETDILFESSRPEPELSTFSYVGSSPVASQTLDSSTSPHTTEKPSTTGEISNSTAGKSTAFSLTYYTSAVSRHTPENKLTTRPMPPGGYITLSSTTASPVAVSTDAMPESPSQPDSDDTRLTYSSPKFTTASDYSSTRKATTKPVFTTAVRYTFRQETTTERLTPDDDGMVQIATISADQNFTKPPMSTTIINNNADSINQIINMLNETGPEILDPRPEPLPEVTLTSTASSGQQSGLSTWVSVDEKPQWTSHNTLHPTPLGTDFSTEKPQFSSTTYYTTKTTSRPSIYATSGIHFPEKESESPVAFPTLQQVPLTSVPTHSKPPAPTVIVLSPPNSAYTTQNQPTVHISTRRPPPYTFYTPAADEISSESTTKKPYFSPKPSTWTVTKLTSTTVKVPPVTSRPPTTVTIRPVSSQIPLINKRPATVTTVTGPIGTTHVTKKPTTYSTWTEYEQVTSIADLANFPPVRNPQLNMSAPQPETPQVVLATEPGPEPVHEVPQVPDDNDITTPEFVEDDKFNDKVQLLVNKIVQSLQGNFEDLEEVIYKPRNVTTAVPPVTQGTTRRPTRRPSTGSTTRRPTTTTTGSTTRRPRPTVTPPRRPSTPNRRPTTTRRPASSQTTTRRPATPVTTRRPTQRPSSTRPRPATTTTTTTTTTTAAADLSIGADATATATATAAATTTANPVDYRNECGVRPLMQSVKTGRIVGGKGATFGEWPWQALVRETTWLGLFTKNKCGGVLITSKFVITAAHCQPGFLANLVVVLGEYDITGELESKRSVTKNVRRVIVHRHYDAATFANDLALLELENPVTFDEHIVPICMPKENEDFTGRMATVTGWGRLKYGGGVPSVLQEVQVPVIENSVCQEMFQTAGHSKVILSSFLCAGYANGQKDSCEGDSGGPLMMERDDGRWVLVGTVSHGIKCASPFLPGVYMRTTYYKPWLQSITGVH